MSSQQALRQPAPPPTGGQMQQPVANPWANLPTPNQIAAQYGSLGNAGAPAGWRPSIANPNQPRGGDPNVPAGYAPTGGPSGPVAIAAGHNPAAVGTTANPFATAPPTLPGYLQPPSWWPQPGGPAVNYPPSGPPDWTKLLQGSGT